MSSNMAEYVCTAIQAGASVIDGVKSASIDPGTAIVREAIDGHVDPRVGSVYVQNPIYDVTSMAIAKVLNLFNTVSGDALGGKNFATGSVVNFYLKKLDPNGQTLTLSHLKLEATSGLMIPQSLTANQETPAEITARAMISAWADTDGLSLPAGVITAANEEFYAGPAKLNNTALDGIQSIELDFGLQVTALREAGSALPAVFSISRREPVIRITTTNANLLSTYRTSVAISAATHFYLRKGDQLGGRVADATAEHIKFTVAAGKIISKPFSGQKAPVVIEIHPVRGDAAVLIDIDTTAAIA